MNFPFYIAKRYFLAKKSHNAINIITSISVAVVAIVSMALIVTLSVFNGLESLIVSLYNSFDPDIKIIVKEGKMFDANSLNAASIKNIPGVIHYCEVIEENAMLKYGDRQYVATIKGVDNEFMKMSGVDSMIVEGKKDLEVDSLPRAIVGYGIAYTLSLKLNDFNHVINIYAPKKGYNASISLDNALNNKAIYPGGIFSIQQEFDIKYMLVPKSFAKDLFDSGDKISAIEIGLSPNADKEKVQETISSIVGKGFYVKNRYQQHDTLYKIMKSEKLAIYFIITFILIIAIFNLIGSLTMLIIDKKDDIAILKNLGANNKLIKRIFLLEGSLISVIGAVSGIILGVIVCIMQQQFKLVKLGGSFVIDAYPVKMQFTDFIFVFLTVFLIGYLAALFPVRQISKKYLS